jgi:high affinity Mn2+ porin
MIFNFTKAIPLFAELGHQISGWLFNTHNFGKAVLATPNHWMNTKVVILPQHYFYIISMMFDSTIVRAMLRQVRHCKTSMTRQILMGLLSGHYCCSPHVAIAAPAEVQGTTSSNNNYVAIAVTPAAQVATAAPAAQEAWNVLGQFTNVTQWHPAFTSPYTGQNSLNPNSNSAETTDLTLFAGMRISVGGELWINPEIDQGFGLSNTLGVAGFPSGEGYKIGANAPYLRLPRLFYRQFINLGGEEQTIASAANQLGRTQSTDNVILTIGKLSVTDVFDTNTYAHDPRSDFFNWSIVESGAFDYAADAWGFTKGASVEWTQSWWTMRGGFFDLSTIPNTTILDPTFSQHEWVGELEERYQLWEHPGKVKLLGFVNQGKMGSYADALQLQRQTGSPTPDTALVRRGSSQSGVAINLEQEVSSDLGAFARASMNNGSKEADDFTEINKSIAAGLSLRGDRWGHHDDTFGFAAVANGLSGDARNYFAAGGMGILIGDGHLNYGLEKIMETYYSFSVHAVDHLMLTLNYQYVVNPAYNQDRGPVSIFGLRVHKEF